MNTDRLTIPVDRDLPYRLHVALWREEPTGDERAYLAECLDSYCERDAHFTPARREARLAARAGAPVHGADRPRPHALPAQPMDAPGVQT